MSEPPTLNGILCRFRPLPIATACPIGTELIRMTTSIATTRITFAIASDSDFEQLLALRIAAMRASLEDIGRFDPQRARDRFRSGFSAEHTRHILLGERRAGFFVVKPSKRELLLEHLYVHPDYQRDGIGAATLQHIFAEQNPAHLPIRVGALRGSDSNRFYLRHGFRQVEETEWDIHYLRPPEDKA